MDFFASSSSLISGISEFSAPMMLSGWSRSTVTGVYSRTQQKTKAELVMERELYRKYYQAAMTGEKKKKNKLDIGYLFASPLIFENKQVT